MTLNVLCLHGIAQTNLDELTFHQRWEQEINEGLAQVKLLPRVRCHNMHWDSMGSAAGDIANMIVTRSFRLAQIASIEAQLQKKLLEIDVVVAHSMGVSLIQPVLSALAWGERHPPLLGIGGPIGHPLWGRALSLVGLRWTEHAPYLTSRLPVHFYNQDDSVATLGTNYSPPKEWHSIRVAVPGEATFFKEHGDSFYLQHPLFVRQIASY